MNRPHIMNRPKRGATGFSLVEMLVVLGIIAMLMGLIIPAMNAARAASRKAHCLTNQKQIGLASLTFESIEGKFPGYQHDLAGNKVGIAVMLFPYLERMQIWDAWSDSTIAVADKPSVYVACLVCPEDAPDVLTGSPNSFISNRGNPPASIGFDSPVVIADSGDYSKSIDWINEKDGTSNTLLCAERKDCGNAERAWSKVGQSGDIVGFKVGGGMKASINSGHSDGFVVIFCDGHGRFLRNRIGDAIYDSLSHPDDGYLDPAKFD